MRVPFTVQTLLVLSGEEQFEGEGETPTRPGRRRGRGGEGVGLGKYTHHMMMLAFCWSLHTTGG